MVQVLPVWVGADVDEARNKKNRGRARRYKPNLESDLEWGYTDPNELTLEDLADLSVTDIAPRPMQDRIRGTGFGFQAFMRNLLRSASAWLIGVPLVCGVESGLTTLMFSNKAMSGDPLVTSVSPNISANWESGSPAEGVPVDGFSVRWYGTITPGHSGLTSIIGSSDDGMRVWIDGRIIIDAWIDRSISSSTGTFDFIAGRAYSIRVEYYESGGKAEVKLEWTPPNQTKQVIPADVFTQSDPQPVAVNDLAGFSSSSTERVLEWSHDGWLTAGYCVERAMADGTFERLADVAKGIHYRYVDSSAIPGSQNTYRVGVISLDGAINYGPTCIVAGVADGEPGYGWIMDMYDDQRFQQYVDRRVVSNINFDWGVDSPDSRIQADSFTVRWQGRLIVGQTGTYAFRVTSDDGVRLWVGNDLVVDQWVPRGATANAVTVPLVQGEADIRMDYFEEGGSASARLEWKPAGATVWVPCGANVIRSVVNKVRKPTPIVATTSEKRGVYVQWGGDANESGYELQKRLIDNSTWSLCASLPKDRESYVDVDVLAGQTYAYRVIALSSAGNSGPSDETTTAIPTPTDNGYDWGEGLRVSHYKYQDFGGAPFLISLDETVDDVWTTTTLPPGVTAFSSGTSTRWEGFIRAPITGEYALGIDSDHATRIWVDDQLVVDRWGWSGRWIRRFKLNWEANSIHTLRIDKMHYGGTSIENVCRLVWTMPSFVAGMTDVVVPSHVLCSPKTMPINGSGLRYSLSSLDDGVTPVAPASVVQKIQGAPGQQLTDLGIQDEVGALWRGWLTAPRSGVYQFDVRSDTALQFHVGSKRLCGRGKPNGVVTMTGDISLIGGVSYPISLFAPITAKTRDVTLMWSGPGFGAQLLQGNFCNPSGMGEGLSGRYYANADYTALRSVRIDKTIDFNTQHWNDGIAKSGKIAVRWKGSIDVPYDDEWRFTAESSSRVNVWIDGELVVNGTLPQWWQGYIHGSASLTHGRSHDIVVEYTRDSYSTLEEMGYVRLLWGTLSQPMAVIPQSQLYPATTSQVADGLRFLPRGSHVLGTGGRAPVVGSSLVSPAWIEGSGKIPYRSIQYMIDGEESKAVRYFGEDGWALVDGGLEGVELHPDRPVDVSVVGVKTDGTHQALTESWFWETLDIAQYHSDVGDRLIIKPGDSVLLAVEGYEAKVDIDVDGDDIPEYHGISGQAWPHRFESVGDYIVRGKMDGSEVGSIRVIVQNAPNYHGRTVAERGLTRTRKATWDAKVIGDLTISPDWDEALGLTVADASVTGEKNLTMSPCLLKGAVVNTRVGPLGPIVHQHALHVFDMRISSQLRGLDLIQKYEDGSKLLGGYVYLEPMISDLTIYGQTRTAGNAFLDGATKNAFPSSVFSVNEGIGSAPFRIVQSAGVVSDSHLCIYFWATDETGTTVSAP